MKKKRIMVFASGSATGGGSGFRNLVVQGRERDLPYEVSAVVTHHLHGGVATHAHALGIQVIVVPPNLEPDQHLSLCALHVADLAVLSGWLKPVSGLPAEKVINIHPGLLPGFGGKGMHGHHVHEKTIEAFKKGEIDRSAVSMHFVPSYERHSNGTDNYDTGPLFASVPVPILADDDASTLGSRVNAKEHEVQPSLTALVAEGRIKLNQDGTVWMEDRSWYEGENLPYN